MEVKQHHDALPGRQVRQPLLVLGKDGQNAFQAGNGIVARHIVGLVFNKSNGCECDDHCLQGSASKRFFKASALITRKDLLYNPQEIRYAGAWFYGVKVQRGDNDPTRHFNPGITHTIFQLNNPEEASWPFPYFVP